MKFAICNEMYEGWDFGTSCVDIAESGYDGVEIAPFTLGDNPTEISERDARKIGDLAKSCGLAVTGFHWLLQKPEGLHLTCPDIEIRKRTKEVLQHLARICAAMEGKIMVFGSPKQRNVLPGETYDAAFGRAVELFRDVCDVAHPLGVTLALEPLSAEYTNFMVSAEETVRVIRAVDHPACRLHLDVNAMCSEENSIDEIVSENREYLAYFHANDPNLRGPGFGDVDFVPIARALKNVGYDGVVSVEVFDYEPNPQTIARESLTYLKRTFREAGAI